MPSMSIVMLATSRTSSSRPPFADSSMCSETLAPLKTIVSVPLRPSTVSLPSPGFQTNESSPPPSMTLSFPRPASTESFPGSAANRLGSRASDEVVVSAAALDRRRDGVGEDAAGLVDPDVVVACAAVDVDAGDVGAGEVEVGRAVVDVDLQDAPDCRPAGGARSCRVGCAHDRQGTVFQLGLLEAVCRGVALRGHEAGHAGEGGRGRGESSQVVHVFLLSSESIDGRGGGTLARTVATPLSFPGIAGNRPVVVTRSRGSGGWHIDGSRPGRARRGVPRLGTASRAAG